MILEGNDIWLFTDELVSLGGKTQSYIRKALCQSRKLRRPTWKSRPHLEDARVKLISYNSLPDRTKSKLPAKAKLKQQVIHNSHEDQDQRIEDLSYCVEELITNQYYNLTNFHYYRKKLDSDRARDLTYAAGAFQLLDSHRSKTDTKKIGFNSKKELRLAMLKHIELRFADNKEYLYGFKFTNLRVLADKERGFRKVFEDCFNSHQSEDKSERKTAAAHAALDYLIPQYKDNKNIKIQ